MQRRRRRGSSFASEINEFAKAFKAGWSMMDRVSNPRGSRGARGSGERRLSPAEERRQNEERELQRYQDDAERAAGGTPRRTSGEAPEGGGSLDRSRSAITSIESSGRYDAVGPVVKSGDRAYGRYQVMGANVGPWTERYYGERLTPAQFLANREAQDAVFEGEFGRLKARHGPEGAARAWFAGERGMNDPNRRDVLGTSVSDYSRKFQRAYGAGGGSDRRAALPTPGEEQGAQEQGGASTQMAQAPEGEPPEDMATDEMQVAEAPADDFADEGWGDAFGEETVFASTGGAIPEPGWQNNAPDAGGARYQRFQRFQALPVGQGAGQGARPAREPLAARRARLTMGPNAPAQSQRPSAGDRLRQIRATRQAEAERRRAEEAAARERAANAGFYKWDDQSAFANRVWAENARYTAQFAEGGYVDRIDPEDYEYAQGYDPDTDPYVDPRDDADEARYRLQREEQERGLRSGGYRQEGGYDETPPTALPPPPPSRLRDDPSGARPERGAPTVDVQGRNRERAPAREEAAPSPPRRPAGDGQERQAAPRRPQQALPTPGGDRPAILRYREGMRPGEETVMPGGPSDRPEVLDRIVYEGARGGVSSAVAAGLGWIQNAFGFTGSAASPAAVNPGAANDPRQAAAVRAFATNAEAPSQEEVRQVDQAMDPQGRLPPHLRSLARLYGGYKFYEERGERDKAMKFAGSMLLNIKRNAQMYGAVVADRLQKGDAQGAAKAAEQAYDQLPDGNRVQVTPAQGGFAFKMFDVDGNLTQQGTLTINEMMRAATGLQDGTEWFRSLGYLAGPGGRGPTRASAPRGRSERAPPEPRLTAPEAREKRQQERIAAENAARIEGVGRRGQERMANIDRFKDTNDPFVGDPEQLDRQRKDTREMTGQAVEREKGFARADEAYRKSIPRGAAPRLDEEEALNGASAVLGKPADGKSEADPFGRVPEALRGAVRATHARLSARAVAANPGLSSEQAGRMVAELFAKGYEVRPDGRVVAKGDAASPGIALDRQSLEDLERTTRAARAAAPSPAAQGQPKSGVVRDRQTDPAAAAAARAVISGRNGGSRAGDDEAITRAIQGVL